VPQRASSGLELQGGKLFKSCLAALEPRTERFMKNPLRMVLSRYDGAPATSKTVWPCVVSL